MARRKGLEVVGRVDHECPHCEGTGECDCPMCAVPRKGAKDPRGRPLPDCPAGVCHVCDGKPRWKIELFKAPPPPPSEEFEGRPPPTPWVSHERSLENLAVRPYCP